jgi:2,3-bisphosphoglycerate-independent phosphoglycerate mutase
LVEGEKAKIPGYGTDVELRNDGKLADIAPTILDILQISQPQEMTGRSLLKPAAYDLQLTRTPVQIGL